MRRQGLIMKNQNISKGDSVYFDIGAGTQSGSVIALLPCITNGRQYATVKLDGNRPEEIATVPADQLSITKEVSNFVFMSEAIDAPSRHHINCHY
jgi:hypothetical protein